MARTTSTQRGASRRTARTASSGPKSRAAAPSSSRKPAAAPRGRASSSRPRARMQRPAGPWLPVAIVALVVVLGWSLYPALRLQYQASHSLAGLEQQRDSMAQYTASLRKQVADLSTPEGVEKAAREDLGYTKKGEHAYIVMPSGRSTGTAGAGGTTASIAGAPEPSLLQVVLDAVFGVAQPASDVEP